MHPQLEHCQAQLAEVQRERQAAEHAQAMAVLNLEHQQQKLEEQRTTNEQLQNKAAQLDKVTTQLHRLQGVHQACRGRL